MKRRKRRLKKRIYFILLIIILLIFILIKNKTNININYSTEAIKIIDENNLKNIYNKEYSKTLDEVLKNNKYNIQYIEKYIVINYREEDNFIDNINKYLEKGYSGKEINDIYKLSKKNQEKLLNKNKIDFKDYIDIINFNVDNYERYNDYKNNNKNLELSKIVTYVNINLDKEFYTDIKTVIPNDYTTIVNKYNRLDKDYKPSDLVTVFDNKMGYKLVDVAENAYEKFIEAAKKDGFTFVSTTTYRTYSFQNTLYTNYVKKDGVKEADTYSARPGHSEHQLGLAVDLDDPNYSGERLNDKDYEWVLNNSYKYGFIVRYPHNSEDITGYMEEPWHIRYLGVELATKVYESKLTYDEYYDIYLTEY